MSQPTRESSFTLIETVMAAFLLATVILEVSQVQGNAVYFIEYGRNVTKASWLAKRIMSQVEYHALTKDWKELSVEERNRDFASDHFKDFKYDILIKEFKLPIVDIIGRAMAPGGGEDSDEGDEPPPVDDTMVSMIKQVLGEEVIKMAQVKVSWPEGAKRNYYDLSYIMPNHRKIDEVLTGLAPALSRGKKPSTSKPTSGTSGGVTSGGGTGTSGTSGGSGSSRGT